MKCIVCENDSWNHLYFARDRMLGLPGTFSELECTSCGLCRISPVPNNLKKFYPSKKYYSYSAKTTQSFFGWLRTTLISHNFLSFVPAMPSVNKGKILDIGCGSGDTLLLLAKLGLEVFGLDIDASAIKAARGRGLKNVSQGSYTQMKNYPDNYFDVIRMYHVIEHLDDPQLCLALAQKKLKKGGELIMGTPNGKSIVASIFRSNWYNLDAPRHLFIFSPAILSALTRKNNFGSIKIQFASAGGWVGSIQYLLGLDLINRQWLVMLFYPLEWVIDRFGLGDVFVLRATKL